MSAAAHYFRALAADFDGTLAAEGSVPPNVVDALRRLKDSGRKILLVTGRELSHLQATFADADIFDLIVAENGAVLFDPAEGTETALAAAADPGLVRFLRESGVAPLSVGRSIVATWSPHDATVLEGIRRTGLELAITYNKGAVMVLPANVNKATGFAVALERLGLSRHNVVAIGDAENDQTFLATAGLSAAVANAIDAVKERVDLVTLGHHGAGVIEIVDGLLADDLAAAPRRLEESIAIGDRSPLRLSPRGGGLLIVGTSGGGKTTIVTRLLEGMIERQFQVVIVDPEGDYSHMPGVTELGNPKSAPAISSVAELMIAGKAVSVNLLAVDREDRPRFFSEFLRHVAQARHDYSRPHWLVVDEAHHVMPAEWDPAAISPDAGLPAMLLVTLHPGELHPAALARVEAALAVGDEVAAPTREIAEAFGVRHGAVGVVRRLPKRHGYLVQRDGAMQRIEVDRPQSKPKRHARKYAEGDLGEARSFYFRGPAAQLNLRAQNLGVFLQIAGGVDDDTWTHHLRRGDVADWFRLAVKDSDLAAAAEEIAGNNELSAAESRRAIEEAVKSRYSTVARPRPAGA